MKKPITNTLKNASLAVFFMAMSISSASANVITQHVSVGTYERDCPGLADPEYMDKYREAVEIWAGPLEDWGDQAVDTVCRFNSQGQAQFWNYDGTSKQEGGITIAPFTPEQVGQVAIRTSTATEQLEHNSATGKLNGSVKLDSENLGLPEIKINATSNAGERNSFNGYAATEYLWTGADETLEFQLNFDFFHSSENWSLEGLPPSQTAQLLLNAYVSENLIIDSNDIFPANAGNIFAQETFNLKNEDVGMTSAGNPYFGNLTVSFDVTSGQRFFVVGQYQGFAKNGGFLDASNTITGALNVEGLTQEESITVFQTSLQAAPVNAPAMILLTLLGAGMLFSRKPKR